MKRKTYNQIIRRSIDTFSAIVSIIFIFSICCLDSESWLPVISTFLSGAWLCFYAWLKGWFYEYEGEH